MLATPWGDSQMTLDSVLGVPSGTQDRRLYHSFLRHIVPALSHSLDAAFWRSDILRNTASRPAVQHAAIALGALYEHRQGQIESGASSGRRSSDSALQTSLLASRYSSAIQALRDRLTDAVPDEYLVEEVMVACLLLVCIERLCDDDVAAVTHLEGALGIYMDFYSSHLDTPRAPKTPSSSVIHSISNIYARLDIQATAYIGSRSTRVPVNCDISDTTLEDSNVTFHTLLQSRDVLNVRIASVLAFITPPYGAEKAFPGWTPHPLRGWDRYCVFHGSPYRDYAPPQVSIHRRRYMKLLSLWKSAFQEFLHTEKENLTRPQEQAEVALLWSSYYITRIRLLTSYTKHEGVYDQCLSQFEKIVEQAELARRYSNGILLPLPINRVHEGKGSTTAGVILSPKKSTEVSIHMGFNYPLYFMALKCRYRPLRRRAMVLLRTSASESVWDVEMLARIASYVIEIEEGKEMECEAGTDGLAERRDGGEEGGEKDEKDLGVPEEKRVHCLALNIDKAERTIWLLFNRRIPTQLYHDSKGDKVGTEQEWSWKIDSDILSW